MELVHLTNAVAMRCPLADFPIAPSLLRFLKCELQKLKTCSPILIGTLELQIRAKCVVGILPLFVTASRSNQHMPGYVLEYIAAEHAIFPPYECVCC